MKIAILASGKGTNFQALAKAVQRGYIKANLKLLITDKKKALVRKRAKALGIKDEFIDPKKYKSRLKFDKQLVKLLKKEKINLILLAGYMRILTPYFTRSFKNKIINIHPALLPAFKGVDAIERAFDYGCKLTGVTVHFVDEKVDHGPIILQEHIKIAPDMNLLKLQKKIHQIEHKLYPLAVKLIQEGKVKIKGRHVKIN